MNAFTGFGPRAFTFLRGLARNNRKEWFEAHRDDYETQVRDPMRVLVDEIDAVLGDIAPEIRGDPKKSVFRIHRDIRFSSDKSPYKTHIAAWFFHHDAGSGVGQEAHGGAGYYVHVEPAACMFGGGIWMPPKVALDRIRDRILEEGPAFEKVVTAPSFRKRFGPLSTEAMLTRTPRGYDAAHPQEKWLRYKSFTAGKKLPDSAVSSRKLIASMKADMETMLPFVRWLNTAIGLKSRASR
jgi:uncharacterized protein (TIGR02453 family)